MPWGKVTKQDLVDVGLDPDKFNNLIGSSVTKEELATMKTEFGNAFTEVKDALKALTEKVSTPVGRGENSNSNGNEGDNGNRDKNRTPTPEELSEQEQLEYISNPVAFINKKNQGLGYSAAVEFKKLSKDLAYKEGLRNLPWLKNSTFKAEFDEEWKKYTPEIFVRNNGDPSVLLQQVYDMLVGKHHDEIVQDRDKKDGKFNLVHSSSGGGGGGVVGTSDTGNKPKITPEEHIQATKFGMSDEEWLKQGEDMEKEEIERRKIPVGA